MTELPGPQPPSKILCVGRNYLMHAKEMGREIPEEPLFFMKPPSSLIGGGTPIRLPKGAGRIDYEGEIALILGRRARAIAEEDAVSYIGGVLPMNDVTAREIQRADSQWTRAKGFDTFCPIGASVPLGGVELDSLTVVTRVNGEERQRGSHAELAFKIPFLISYLSHIMTLEAGDIIATGTPAGIGSLAHGDEVEVELIDFGSVRNPVVDAALDP
jgi:2-keto-4-pentenoate hydratase/2-oxohepta-3-ene-1,7-dioic acid hydratase in catechol pathway